MGDSKGGGSEVKHNYSPLPFRGGAGGGAPQDSTGVSRGDADSAEAGMKHMAELFKETGSELYMGAGDREHD